MFRFLILAASLLAAAPAAAQFGSNAPMVDASLVTDRVSAAPGETFHIALHQDITPGWHTYWRNPGDSGEPTRLELTLPDGWSAGEIIWPAPSPYPLGPLTNYGYSDTVTLPMPVAIPADAPAGEVIIPAFATWLVCEDICIPEEAALTLTVQVGDSIPDLAGEARILSAIEAAPIVDQGVRAGVEALETGLAFTVSGDAFSGGAEAVRNFRLYPHESGVIDHAAPQRIALADGEVRIDVAPGYLTRSGVSDVHPAVLTFEALQGGAWTPVALTVEPAPGAPVNALAPAAAPSPSGPTSPLPAAETPSIGFAQAALLALLGGLILNLMPCVFPILSMKALTLVEKRGAARSEARMLGLVFAAGVIGTFLALGILLLALRVAGLPGLWGVQLQVPVVVAGLSLLMFLIGLNFLGVFEVGTSLQTVGSGVRDTGKRGAFLTGVLAVFVAAPCLAPFMAGALTFALAQPPAASLAIFGFLGVGLALPFVLVSFFPAVLAVLPRPGPWMVRFRQVLAFPMFATAIWLIWVLTAQVGANGVLWVLGAFLAAGFAVWAFSLRGAAARITAIAGVVLAAGALAGVARLAPVASSTDAGAHWAAWSPDIVAEVQAEGRPVFVDFTAAWCVTCQVNKLGTLSNEAVRDVFAENEVRLLRADFTNRDPVIAAELARRGAAGVPLYLVFPADGGEPEVLPPLLTTSIVIRAVERAVEG